MYKREDIILFNMANIGKKSLEKLPKKDLLEKVKKAEKEEKDLEKELKLIKRHSVEVITIFEEAYPKLLKEIYDPPIVLYVKGSALNGEELAIAVVGSRFASLYGVRTAEKFGYELASRGAVVISGLARGVDTAAHKGAIKAHGKTIAVLGNGLSTIYPPENKKFAGEIIDKGGSLVSEFPMDASPIPQNFPRRNRVISGLSLAVVVVEAAKNSGALITADFALEQGRDVFAVPGSVDSATSFGTNELIKQGAKLAQTAEDVLQELDLKLNDSKAGAKKHKITPNLSEEEMSVYKNLSQEPRYVDDIIQDTKLSVGKAMELLLALQLKKLVKELPGKNFIKT